MVKLLVAHSSDGIPSIGVVVSMLADMLDSKALSYNRHGQAYNCQ